MTDALVAAYSATGAAWQAGPGRIYDRLATVLVAASPVALGGLRVLDVGAGTGAASRAVLAAGATAVALDPAVGMLAHAPMAATPAVAGDAVALPFPRDAFGAAVAAFSLSHLEDPAAGLGEMTRVTRPGGAVIVSAYASDDGHPVKAAVEGAVAARGWTPDPWVAALRDRSTSLFATPEDIVAAAAAAGIEAEVTAVRVPFPELQARDLVAWRLGMAQLAPFVARLSPGEREAVAIDAVERLGPAVPELVRSILVLRAVSP